ncbi:gibberellin-regulated protein 1-like [Dendrobium catenatum]|uniref:gibberellin-regulated protein 1-like n=1 Tax=Dendrobium catenatum TaxID=906689 RepID=UPI00109F7B98|nr:gibberellin-regulated protein 1-like [Dendrobium catenatum]
MSRLIYLFLHRSFPFEASASRRACGTCCARCNCVPPGTYGNQYMCPCYAALTTHHGRRKCP